MNNKRIYTEENIEGQRFGSLVAVKNAKRKNKQGKYFWLFKCDCGAFKEINKYYVTHNGVRSCGCLKQTKKLENANKLIGTQIGELTVIRIVGGKKIKKSNGTHYDCVTFECRCSCGTTKILTRAALCNVISCGCLTKKNTLRGGSTYNAGLTNKEADAIRQLKSTNMYTNRELAKMQGINESTMCRLINNKTYKKGRS